MKTIEELWGQIIEHPDFVTGRLWTKQNVINCLTDRDDEDFDRIAPLFVDKFKSEIKDEIDSFELDNYEYGTWVDNMDKLIEEGKQKIFSYDSEIA